MTRKEELKSQLGRYLETGTPRACVDAVAKFINDNPDVHTANIRHLPCGLVWEIPDGAGFLEFRVDGEGRLTGVSREGWPGVEVKI